MPSKANVAMQFFAFGDTPYDKRCDTCNTCIAEDGVTKQADCTRFDCILKYITESQLPKDNTCTFEGPDYACVNDVLIPYMNSKIASGDAAFIAHAGDFLGELTWAVPGQSLYSSLEVISTVSVRSSGGSGFSASPRCNQYAFASRRDLFGTGTNLLLVPGDNDWNEVS